MMMVVMFVACGGVRRGENACDGNDDYRGLRIWYVFVVWSSVPGLVVTSVAKM